MSLKVTVDVVVGGSVELSVMMSFRLTIGSNRIR